MLSKTVKLYLLSNPSLLCLVAPHIDMNVQNSKHHEICVPNGNKHH